MDVSLALVQRYSPIWAMARFDRIAEAWPMDFYPSLADLIVELRKNSPDDVAFAQRIALVCCCLIERDQASTVAIQTVFKLREA